MEILKIDTRSFAKKQKNCKLLSKNYLNRLFVLSIHFSNLNFFTLSSNYINNPDGTE